MSESDDILKEIIDAARDILGSENIGKTVDIWTNWNSDISVVIKGPALTRLREAILHYDMSHVGNKKLEEWDR